MSKYINPVTFIQDINGQPIVGAKLFFFETGSGTTLKPIYIDPDFGAPHTNPVIANASGRFPVIYLDGIYKVEMQDNSGTPTGYDGVTLWTDPTVGEAAIDSDFQPWSNSRTYVVGSFVKGSDGEYYKSKIDPNIGNDPTVIIAAWTLMNFGEAWNSTTDYPVSATAYAGDGFEYLSIVTPNVGNDPRTSANWMPATRQGQSAFATGTVDAITAAFIPPFTALKDGMEVRVRALGANTITNPTFSPDGITSSEIKKLGNQLLLADDISGAGHELLLKYNLSLDVWELINPANIATGSVIQQSMTTSNVRIVGSVAMTTVNVPVITEGVEYMTAVITPKFIGSEIHILFNGYFLMAATGSGQAFTLATFVNNETDAIFAEVYVVDDIYAAETRNSFGKYTVTSLSPVTFRFRAGEANGLALAINGNTVNATPVLGGVQFSSIVLTEVQA